MGSAGQNGAEGIPGVTGPPGPQGIQGPVGATGPVGPQGLAGPGGVQGPAGPTGPAGPAGEGFTPKGQVPTVGDLPPSGNHLGDAYTVQSSGHMYVWDGAQWVDMGPIGIQGPPGPQGPTGATGPAGPTGLQGATGPAGPQGIQGPKGDPGATGSQGPAGSTGAQGPAGPGVIPGGTTGQVLTKNTGTNYDTIWSSPFTQTLADARYLQLTGGTLSGNLLFSTDNTCDIGASGTRPRDLWLGRALNIGTANERIRNEVNALASISVESADGWAALQGKLGTLLGANAYYDGSAWQRFDIATAAMHFNMNPTGFALLSASAGANPISAWTQLMSLSSAGVLTLPNGSVTTPMLAANAAQQMLGQYAANTTFSTTAVGSWVATPALVNVTTSGGTVRLELSLTMTHTGAGAFYYVAILRDGGIVGSQIVHQSVAGYNTAIAMIYYDTPPAGAHTYGVYVNNQGAGTLATQPSTTTALYANEQKR